MLVRKRVQFCRIGQYRLHSQRAPTVSTSIATSQMNLLTELSQLGTIFGIFAVIFVVKSRVSIVEL
jgi:hypothetical protein